MEITRKQMKFLRGLLHGSTRVFWEHKWLMNLVEKRLIEIGGKYTNEQTTRNTGEYVSRPHASITPAGQVIARKKWEGKKVKTTTITHWICPACQKETCSEKYPLTKLPALSVALPAR